VSTSSPCCRAARRIVTAARQQGLLVLTCGTQGETVRILVPLTIPDADLDAGLAILRSVIAEAGPS
jgi:4-aminobutyrate aminotransferase-like enzyme